MKSKPTNKQEIVDIDGLQEAVIVFEQFNISEMRLILSYIKILNSDGIGVDADSVRDKLTDLLLHILSYPTIEKYNDDLSKAVYDFLFIWRKHWPNDKTNFQVGVEVKDEDKILTSIGWFDIHHIISWHNEREFFPGEGHKNGKYLLNPHTGIPFNRYDVQHIQAKAEELGMPKIVNLTFLSHQKEPAYANHPLSFGEAMAFLLLVTIGGAFFTAFMPMFLFGLAGNWITLGLGAIIGAYAGICSISYSRELEKAKNPQLYLPATEIIIVSPKIIEKPPKLSQSKISQLLSVDLEKGNSLPAIKGLDKNVEEDQTQDLGKKDTRGIESLDDERQPERSYEKKR